MSLAVQIIKIYTLLVFIRALLSFSDLPRYAWRDLLDRITEPPAILGRSIVRKLFPSRAFSFDIGPVSGLLVCLVIVYVLKILF